MKSIITMELDYHPGVGLKRVEELLEIAATQYGVREATITVDDTTIIRKNRPQLSMERRARQRRNAAKMRRVAKPTGRGTR